MSCNLTFEQWCMVATVVLSVVAIVIAILSSRQTSKDATKQIASVKALSRVQLDATILLLEEELFRAKVECKKVEHQTQIGAQERGNNISAIEGMLRVKESYRQSFEPILQDYQTRISRLQQTINELKKQKI